MLRRRSSEESGLLMAARRAGFLRSTRIAALIPALMLLVPAIASAQMRTPWTSVPSVTVLGRADDPRVPLVRGAVACWNRNFAEIGSPFRRGAVAVVAGAVPEERLQALSNAVVSGARVLEMTPGVEATPGNIVVAL